MENKITISELNPGEGLLVWDNDQSTVIASIHNTEPAKDVDLTARIIDLVEDEYNSTNVKILQSVHIEGYEDNIDFEVGGVEDGDEMVRNLRITRIGVY